MDILRLLPKFWLRGRPTSKAWDEVLNYALDHQGVLNVTRHEAIVGPFAVWISNYPFAFGYNRDDALEMLPRVRTQMRLRRAIEQFQKERYMRMMQQ